MVKIIWHTTASPPQTDGSVVFARWRQCAHMGGHIGATWRIRLNLCFLRPTRVHNPNDKSISSAVSANLTAESPYTLQWVPLFPKIVPFHGESGPHLTHDSLGPSEPTNQTASLSIQPFLQRWLQSVPILYNGMPLFPIKIAPSHGGIWTPFNTWFPEPTWVLNPNGISVGSVVLAGLTNVTDRHTTLLGR